MSFEIKDKDLAGRIGKLRTKSGTVETPAFFPVVNPFRTRESVTVEKIREIGFNQVITNAFIIMQRLGDDAVKMGVHKVVGYDGVIMTDSGAYQLLMYGKERIKIDPIKIVEFQDRIGSDIAVIADIPTRDDSTYEEALVSVEETLRRAKAVAGMIEQSKTLWVLPIQGGVYVDLVARSAAAASSMNEYGMYAIGSPVTVLEKYEFWKIVDMVATAKKYLPYDKPVHLFGGGHPIIMPLMVALGIDSFDSASYILYARDGRYITEHGTYRIKELDYLPCECPVCSKYEPGEILEMPREERVRLIATHNLYIIAREIRRIKEAIREGRLWELIEERARTHPYVREALNHVIKYVDWIERLDPVIRGKSRGLFLYDRTSYFRPELLRHRKRVIGRILKEIENGTIHNIVLIPANTLVKPFHDAEYFKKILKNTDVTDEHTILFYVPFFDIVPYDIDETYPYSQFEAPLHPEPCIINMMCNTIRRIFKIAQDTQAHVKFVYASDIEGTDTCREVLEFCEMSNYIQCIKID